ncbi:MAG: hypothetical protein C0604_01530 [Clostridiales bacterium]|nr:MAG: hypothetical protein C0604_01530 [Clostridiales bacterium]
MQPEKKLKYFKRDKPLDGLKVFSGFFFIAEYIYGIPNPLYANGFVAIKRFTGLALHGGYF